MKPLQVEKDPQIVIDAEGGQQDGFFPKGTSLAGWDWVTHGLAWLSGFLIAVLTLLVTSEVVLRYFFKNPLGWSVEISEYIVLFITFLAAPWVLKYDQHVRVDVLVGALPPFARSALKFVGNVLGLSACLLLLYFSGILFYDSYVFGTVVEKVLRVPRALLVGVIPLSCALMAGYFTRALLRGRFDAPTNLQAPADSTKEGAA